MIVELTADEARAVVAVCQAFMRTAQSGDRSTDTVEHIATATGKILIATHL